MVPLVGRSLTCMFERNSGAMNPEARFRVARPCLEGERIAKPAERATRLAGLDIPGVRREEVCMMSRHEFSFLAALVLAVGCKSATDNGPTATVSNIATAQCTHTGGGVQCALTMDVTLNNA